MVLIILGLRSEDPGLLVVDPEVKPQDDGVVTVWSLDPEVKPQDDGVLLHVLLACRRLDPKTKLPDR